MRTEKISLVAEVRDQMARSGYVILSDYRGLKVQHLTELRRRLRGVGTEVHVVKNAFIGIAARELGWDGAATMLDGPTAVIFGAGDVTEVAKVLKTFAREHKALPAVRGGWMGARRLSGADVEAMAVLPSRHVLLGQFVGTLAAPMTQLVGVLQQKVLSLLYVLKAIEEKKQKAQ